MAKHSNMEMVRLTIRVPRGQDGFWKVILDLDKSGPWTVRAVDGRCNVDTASVKDFVRRLVAGKYAEAVGQVPQTGTGKIPAITYRLLQRPVETPRLDRKGAALAEPMYATLWRTMKMAKVFSASELAADASTKDRPIPVATARQYLTALAKVDVIAPAEAKHRGVEPTYRLVRNLGARAPSVGRAQLVFDPNSRELLAQPFEEQSR